MRTYKPDQLVAALHAPVTPYTWEVQAALARTVQDTGRIPLRWNRPVLIVGMYASVLQNSTVGGGLLIPSTDAITVEISANQEDRFTNRLEDTAATGLVTSFVTLEALSVQTPRLTEIRLENAAPQVDVAFRWKTNNPASPTYEDAYCSLAFYCVYL
jgi:hypothetical protein